MMKCYLSLLVCEEKPDIAFVVDSSHSVGRRNFDLLKRFVANVTEHFDDTNFALMRFGTLPKVIFDFKTSARWNRYQLERSIKGMRYKYGKDLLESFVGDAYGKYSNIKSRTFRKYLHRIYEHQSFALGIIAVYKLGRRVGVSSLGVSGHF